LLGLIAAVVTAAAVTTAVLVWRLLRWPIFRRVLIGVARINYIASPPERRDRPYGFLLLLFARELGKEQRSGETPNDFVQRVFKTPILDVEEHPAEKR
jgi:hypothetical protein